MYVEFVLHLYRNLCYKKKITYTLFLLYKIDTLLIQFK